MTRANVLEQINLGLRRNAPRQKKLVISAFPWRSTQHKGHSAAAPRPKKGPPLPSPPSRGREERGLSATGVHGVWSDNERPKDSHKPGKIL